jgi:transporter family-2 protein
MLILKLYNSRRYNTMYKLYSALIGILLSIMIAINGILANKIGNYPSVVIIHIVGLFGIILILLIKKIKFNLSKNQPIYLYSAGAIGVFTVLFSNISFNHLGVSISLALCLLGQSVASIIIDHYGLFGMEVIKFKKKKILSLIIICLGIMIMTLY